MVSSFPPLRRAELLPLHGLELVRVQPQLHLPLLPPQLPDCQNALPPLRRAELFPLHGLELVRVRPQLPLPLPRPSSQRARRRFLPFARRSCSPSIMDWTMAPWLHYAMALAVLFNPRRPSVPRSFKSKKGEGVVSEVKRRKFCHTK